MKKFWNRTAALLLSAALIFPLIPTAEASEVMGPEVRKQTRQTAPGVVVTSQSMWDRENEDLRTENYFTYIPDGEIMPRVCFGEYLTSRQTLTDMARALESEDLRVVAGINASFYESNGCPIGVVIRDGRLQASTPNYGAVGFRKDGTAVVGTPQLSIYASWFEEDRWAVDENGDEYFIPGQPREITIAGFNKIRNAGGYYLTSGVYASNTGNTLNGVDVVLEPYDQIAEEGLPLDDFVRCQVVDVRDSLEDTSIPEGCFILTMNNQSDPAQLALLSALQPGTNVTLEVLAEEPWDEVREGIGGLYLLVEDGKVSTAFPKELRAPRTAVGQKEDGSLVFYTLDGRQSGYSIGGTYEEVARRLIELGCVTAVAMDGGGSTSLGVTYPQEDSFRIINRPSDAKPRKISTALFLTVPDDGGTGFLAGFDVSAGSDLVPAGTSMPLSAAALDTDGRVMSWDYPLEWSAKYGTVTSDGDGGWIYTAPESDVNRFDTVTVSGDGETGSLQLVVVGRPTAVRIVDNDGQRISGLQLKGGETAQLRVSASYYAWTLSEDTFGYDWDVSGSTGTLDENGLFAAVIADREGSITVSFAGVSDTIPVSVQAPFADIEGHWARKYIRALYALGISDGEAGSGGRRVYHPDRSLTRGELMVMIVRMLGIDPADYSDVELPFADSESIPKWARPYVRAAYALKLVDGVDRGGKKYADAGEPVSREQAMTLIGRTLDEVLESDLSAFSDGAQVSRWASSYVQTLVALNIVEGSKGRLAPKDDITRGEIAKILSMVAALETTRGLPSETPGPPIP